MKHVEQITEDVEDLQRCHDDFPPSLATPGRQSSALNCHAAYVVAGFDGHKLGGLEAHCLTSHNITEPYPGDEYWTDIGGES